MSLLSVFLFASSVHAFVLQPIPEPQIPKLEINLDDPSLPCDQIVNRLLKYNDMARQHDQSVAGFVAEVSTLVAGWHTGLQSYEGRQQRIAPGTFDELLKGSEKIARVTDAAFDNSSLLAAELDRIIIALRDCSDVNKKK